MKKFFVGKINGNGPLYYYLVYELIENKNYIKEIRIDVSEYNIKISDFIAKYNLEELIEQYVEIEEWEFTFGFTLAMVKLRNTILKFAGAEN